MGCVFPGSASSAEPLDKNYVRSLAVPEHVVFVMEYRQADQSVADREGLRSKAAFSSVSSTEFAVDQKRHIQLYGVEPCSGAITVRREGYVGSCENYARAQLEILLKHPGVVFCRAFIDQRGKSRQQATCFAYHNFPGRLNSIDMLEEQLVSIGALRLSRSKVGKPLRPDLEEAEQIAKKNAFGLWEGSGEKP
ncbi:hypothetical protein FHP24_03215 [Aliirhizobium smilacinae]|uniref:TNase-like domain-containing protein n=1 Tax=Aliirhizobium smilacinae TaxID=1395944 RepID=A0A5C4XU59_9HYPH|nr:hypothetical protein FHP24_03215 [Rhizobium smilacinae]